MALQFAHGLLTGSIKPTDTKVQVGKLGEHKVGKDGNIVLGPAFRFDKDNIDSFNS